MAKQYSAKEINRKFKGVYVEVISSYDYPKNCDMFEIVKKSKTIRENMTLGEDLGTPMEYCR